MVVGILNTLAALASPTTLFFSVWRSIDWTPNAICGWWSMKRICEFCGVRTSSFGLVIGDLPVYQISEERLDVAVPSYAKKSRRVGRQDPGEHQFDDLEGRDLLHAGCR